MELIPTITDKQVLEFPPFFIILMIASEFHGFLYDEWRVFRGDHYSFDVLGMQTFGLGIVFLLLVFESNGT